MNVSRRNKIRLEQARPRNPVAVAARLRHSGRHEAPLRPSRAQSRQLLQRQLRRADD